MEAQKPHRFYQFGEFELDVRQRRFSRRGSSEPLAITTRAFDTLLYLVENRGRLVAKTELLDTVWSGVVVEESNLSTTVHALRRLLGERPDDHRYIVTVSGHGYRFVADVVELDPDARSGNGVPAGISPPPATPAPGSGRRRALGVALASILVLGALAAFLLVPRLSETPEVPAPALAVKSRVLTPLSVVAVLPFENLTNDPALNQPGADLVRSLSQLLSEAPGLSVVAQRSADAHANTLSDVRALARELGATHLIEFTISGSGKALKISAQLIDGGAGYQVWAREFHRDREAFLKNRDDVMLTVASVVENGAGATVFGDREPGTHDVEAHIDWLRGIKAVGLFTEQDFSNAIEHLGKATQRDPEFSQAWLSLAAAHSQMMSFGYERPDSISRFREALDHARATRPDSQVAGFSYLTVAIARGRWKEAEEHYQATHPIEGVDSPVAIELYLQTGRVRAAEHALRREQSTAPGNPVVALSLAIVCSIADKIEESQQFADQAVRGGISDDVLLMKIFRANSAERAGRLTDAANSMMTALSPQWRASGGDEAVRRYYQALGTPAARGDAIAALKRLEPQLNHDRYDTYLLRALLIYWYARLDSVDDAYRLADDWLVQYRRNGLVGYPHLAPLWSPRLREFRRDPRFARFATGLNLVDYWKRYGPPDDCRLDGDKLQCD